MCVCVCALCPCLCFVVQNSLDICHRDVKLTFCCRGQVLCFKRLPLCYSKDEVEGHTEGHSFCSLRLESWTFLFQNNPQAGPCESAFVFASLAKVVPRY